MDTNMDRRSFLTGAALAMGAFGAAGLSGCAPKTSGASKEEELASTSGSAETGGWKVAPEPITDIAETVDTDIVIVGAGNAGMCAAATAAEAGARVVVLERYPDPQASRSWIGAYNTKLQKEQGYEYDRNFIANDIQRYSTYLADQKLINAYLDNSGEMMDWWIDLMTGLGAEVMLESASDDYEYFNPAWAHHTVAAPFKPEGGNTLYVANTLLVPYCEGLGVDFRFECPADQLVQESEGGRVTGVIATDAEGKHIQFNAAKGVLVCTGGFAGNQEMLEDLTKYAHRYCTFGMDITRPVGDGMKMMVWAGADYPNIQETMIFDRGTVMPDTELGWPMTQGGIWYGGSLPFLRVNINGERFANEDQLYDWNWNAAVTQPGHTWWQLFDAKYYADAAKFGNTRCARVVADPDGKAMNTAWIDGKSALTEEFLAGQLDSVIGSGAAVQADSIEGLAEAMGCDPAVLKATVDRYNELAKSGNDDDFGKMSSRLSTLEEGPFTAVHCAGWLLCSLGGVRCTTDSQVVNTSGEPIEGLYVAGNDQGGFYGTTYPETYGGLNMGRNLTFARIAVKHMLGEA